MADVGDAYRFGNWSGAVNEHGTLSEAFSTIAGTATDPTDVTLTIERPDETTLEYGWPAAGLDGTLVQESAGRFYADVVIDQAGTWQYRLAGTGAVTAASEGHLRVQTRRVG